MSEDETTQPETPTAALPEVAQQMTLDDFASRLSARDRRVEMVSAFAALERRDGRESDTEAAYAERYAAFTTQPA